MAACLGTGLSIRPLTAVTMPDSLAPRRPLILLDPGWLFLFAGAAMLVITVLIPAQDELAEAELARDRARLVERHAATRLENYTTYLDAVRRGEPQLALSLAATHLNLVPASRSVLPVPGEPPQRDISPFPALEPPPAPTLYRQKPDTILQKWTTDDTSRLWLLAGGSFCVLLGLLPATTQSNRRRRSPDGPAPRTT